MGALRLAARCPQGGCGFLPADCQETRSLSQGSLLLYQVFPKSAKNEEYMLYCQPHKACAIWTINTRRLAYFLEKLFLR